MNAALLQVITMFCLAAPQGELACQQALHTCTQPTYVAGATALSIVKNVHKCIASYAPPAQK